MKKCVAVVLAIVIVFGAGMMNIISVYAEEKKEVLSGKTYEFGEGDSYALGSEDSINDTASRMYLNGDFSNTTSKDGFVSYAVKSGNLKIMVDDQYAMELLNTEKPQDWHVVSDKTKTVDATKLSEKINSGAIIVQTSKDGKTWINAITETDFNNHLNGINVQEVSGEERKSFYETSNVQLTNGCYYRILVAYKMEREVDPSKVLFVTVDNKEEKKCLEVYQFYAYDSSVNQTESLSTKDAYEFGTVYRVDDQDGFENPESIKSNDPHNDWSVGKFYISGYTDVRMDGDVPVFLKVPGDKAALWFNLEQELNKCNGRTDVKINNITSGSDLYFGTPTIDNFGRGALIIRKTDKQNQNERQIYTNYLEASATVGANTRVDLFEEGDYEVALDYQLHYDKPFVFGTTTTKTLTYRIFFKFKVRNGDISLFLRDIDTNQFISNANIAEHGFYIDVANSQYLNMSIKREVLTESMDGLVEDTKFAGVAKEGKKYTDEGIYTVTVKNIATGDSIDKKVYVGNSDVLRAHMLTGLSISEINEQLANGAYIDKEGHILDAKHMVVEEEPEESDEDTKSEEEIAEKIVTIETKDEGTGAKSKEENNPKYTVNYLVVTLAVVIACIILVIVLLKKTPRKTSKKEEEDEQ